MAELQARSFDGGMLMAVWSLPEGQALKLGKKPRARVEGDPEEHACDLVASWDGHISDFHARLKWENGRLSVERRVKPAPTTNPVRYPTFSRDKQGPEANTFEMGPGESFSIGLTMFTLAEANSGGDVTAMTLSADQLRGVRFLN